MFKRKLTEDFLTKILKKKKAYLKVKKAASSKRELKEKVAKVSYPYRPFKEVLIKQKRIGLIAEIKRASPSEGILRSNFDPVAIAKIYQDCKVDALSVLTEEDYFQGRPSYIKKIRQEVTLPILRKDFIIDEYQIYESRLLRADAILLIATILSADTLSQFLNLAKDLGLECLVEVHDEDDLNKALSTDAQIIGINNRNLRSLELDLSTTERLTPLIPKDKIIVSESGISTQQDIQRFKKLGINSVLIGEAFMTSADIKAKVKELVRWLG